VLGAQIKKIRIRAERKRRFPKFVKQFIHADDLLGGPLSSCRWPSFQRVRKMNFCGIRLKRDLTRNSFLFLSKPYGFAGSAVSAILLLPRSSTGTSDVLVEVLRWINVYGPTIPSGLIPRLVWNAMTCRCSASSYQLAPSATVDTGMLISASCFYQTNSVNLFGLSRIRPIR
jgi:hypothetical protein